MEPSDLSVLKWDEESKEANVVGIYRAEHQKGENYTKISRDLQRISLKYSSIHLCEKTTLSQGKITT